MRIARTLQVSIVVLGVLLGLVSARAQTPPEQVEAYVMVVKAEQAEKQGSLQDARDLYEKAHALYRTVSDQYPKWRPDLVQYRVTHCLNQITRLDHVIASASTAAPEKAATIKPAEKKEVKDSAPVAGASAQVRPEFAEIIGRLEAQINESESARAALQEKITALEGAVAYADEREITRQRELAEWNRTSVLKEEENKTLLLRVKDLEDAQEKEKNSRRKKEEQREADLKRIELENKGLLAEKEKLASRTAVLEQAAAGQLEKLKSIEKKKDDLEADAVIHKESLLAATRERDALSAQIVETEKNQAAEKDELLAERDRLTAEVTALKEAAEKNSGELSEARKTITGKNKEIKEAAGKLEEYDAAFVEMARLNELLQTATNDLHNLRAQLNESQITRDRELAELMAERDRLVAEAAALKEAAETSAGELSGALKTITTKEQELKDAAVRLEEYDAVVVEMGHLNELLQSATNDLLDARAQLAESQKNQAAERDELLTERDQLKAEVEALKETVDFNASELNKIKELRASVRSLEKDVEDKDRELEKMRNSKEDAKNAEMNRLKAQNGVLLEEVQDFRARLEAAERKIREQGRENAGLPPP